MILSEVEIIFGVTEDLIDGGYIAAAWLWHYHPSRYARSVAQHGQRCR